MNHLDDPNNWQNKFQALIHEIRGISDNIAIYPAAVKGLSEEKDYEQRDAFKNGWNKAVIEYGFEVEAAADRAAEGMDEDTTLLLASGYVTRYGNELLFSMGDVWAWALSASRIIPKDKIPEVADLYRRWGWPGLLYWETLQPNGFKKSEFKDNNRFIQFVKAEEDQRKKIPDSNKRAYADLQT